MSLLFDISNLIIHPGLLLLLLLILKPLPLSLPNCLEIFQLCFALSHFVFVSVDGFSSSDHRFEGFAAVLTELSVHTEEGELMLQTTAFVKKSAILCNIMKSIMAEKYYNELNHNATCSLSSVLSKQILFLCLSMRSLVDPPGDD